MCFGRLILWSLSLLGNFFCRHNGIMVTHRRADHRMSKPSFLSTVNIFFLIIHRIGYFISKVLYEIRGKREGVGA